MDLKVSVVTVCYNAEEFIENAINSVLEQTYKNIEHIIIDGNSTDNTIFIINKYKDKVAYFSSEPDNGIYDAMNKGIRAASGDILYFLNSDDEFYDKHVIENVIPFFQQNINIELIFGPVIVFNPVTNESFVKTHENVRKSYFLSNVICQQAIFYKTDSFKKVGLFDDTLKIVGDYEWELRAFYKYNIKRKYVPQIMAIFRDGGIGSSEKYAELHLKEKNDAFFRYFNKFEYYKYQLFRITLSKIRASR